MKGKETKQELVTFALFVMLLISLTCYVESTQELFPNLHPTIQRTK